MAESAHYLPDNLVVSSRAAQPLPLGTESAFGMLLVRSQLRCHGPQSEYSGLPFCFHEGINVYFNMALVLFQMSHRRERVGTCENRLCLFFFFEGRRDPWRGVCVCWRQTHTHILLWYCRAVSFLPFIPSQQRCQENRPREKESLSGWHRQSQLQFLYT